MKQIYSTTVRFISLAYLPFHNWIERCFSAGAPAESFPVLIKIKANQFPVFLNKEN